MMTRIRPATMAAALAAVALLAATQVLWPGSGLADPGTTPSGVSVFVTGETSATVAWQAVANAKDYRVQYAPSDEDYRGWNDLDWNKFPTGTSVDLTNLEADTEYKVRVRARFQGSPASPWSAEHLFETPEPEPDPADSPPSGVEVSVTGETSATVSWQAVDKAKDYRVQYSPSDEGWKGWGNLDWNKYPTGTSVDLTNLEAGTEYKVRVRSRFQGSPASPWSAELLFETHEPAPEKDKEEEETVVARSHDTGTVAITYHGRADHTAARPTNVTVVRRNHKDVHITWTKPTRLAFGNYHLYRRWSGADTDGVKCIHLNLGPSRTSYTDTSVASYHPGGGESTYEYRLYTRVGNAPSCGGGWPGNTTGYVKIVVPVEHHEDVYAATDTGTVVHNDPTVPTITRLTTSDGGATHGKYIQVEWNAIDYAPGYRVQYKKTSEAETEWKETYQYRIVERIEKDSNNVTEFDNCTGSPAFTDDGSGERAEERGTGTRLSDFQLICRRNNYPTDQVAHKWPMYWGADGEDFFRPAPTRVRLQRLDANTRYDVRVAMCTELEVGSVRPYPVCAAVGDYSTKRTITSAP